MPACSLSCAAPGLPSAAASLIALPLPLSLPPMQIQCSGLHSYERQVISDQWHELESFISQSPFFGDAPVREAGGAERAAPIPAVTACLRPPQA